MEQIEGVDLYDICSEIEAQDRRAKQEEVAKIVRGIYANIAQWTTQRDDAIRTITKLEEKLKAAREKLQQIKDGNWAPINLQAKKEGEQQ